MIHSDFRYKNCYIVVAWISMAQGISGSRWTRFRLGFHGQFFFVKQGLPQKNMLV